MLNEISEYVALANAHGGICERYRNRVFYAKSKKELIDCAFEAQGIEFICRSKMEGWCLRSRSIMNNFGRYMNGRYTHEDRYSSQMYCLFKGAILADVTCYCVIDSDMMINIPKYAICEIHVCGKSNVSICGNGKAVLVVYGEEPNVSVSNAERMKVKKIFKSM